MTDRTKSMFFLCIICAFFLFPAASKANVKAWEGKIVIPTYGWAEDINPKFWALEGQVKFSTTVKGTIVYPYTMQDHLYRTRENRTYKALFLENEYLKITCLPEMGGRLHSVIDKTQNKEVFHANQVIKPSMIAMRGAFISGGVEWNAGPQVHTVTIVSPVDALTGTNPDGSAFLEIANLEKTLRTRWTVRLTLHPGKKYLDEQISIFNPTDAINPYYFWNCTAFPCHSGTRYIYPMTLGTDHNGLEFFHWPINEGKDLSWLKNYETWDSIFSVDCTYDFFGAYDVHADCGVVQVADHNKLSGKKAWTWGNWDFGLVSQKNLTDNDGPYIEVQSGPLPTQSDYGMLLPRQTVSWQEWWYPVHGLEDGFEYATKDISLQTIDRNGTVHLKMIPTGKFPNAECTVVSKGKTILKKRINLLPDKAITIPLDLTSGTPANITVTSRNKVTLASFTTPLPIPEASPPARPTFEGKSDDELTAEELFLKAQKFDLATDRNQARIYYKKAIALDEYHSPSLRNLAILDFEAALYTDAAEHLEKSIHRNPSDGIAWYFLGLCNLKLNNHSEALRCGYRAVRCLGTESLGYDLTGHVYMQTKDYPKALSAFKDAMWADPRDPKVKSHYLIAMYAMNDNSAFKQARKHIRQRPTDLVLRSILALENNNKIKQFASDVRDFVGEDDFEMIETSLTFAELGMGDQAAKLLHAVCVDAVSPDKHNPLPLYYLAYYHSLQNNKAKADQYLTLASKTHRDFVFPSRPEAVPVLQYAINQNPADAYAHLHLGNLYAHLGRLDEAMARWQKAAQLDPSLSIAFRNMGLYTLVVDTDLDKAADLYKKAIAARPKDQTLHRDLAEILLADNKRPQAIKVLESTPFQKLRRADIIITLAQAYVDEKSYTDAIDLLESTPYFVNWEGQTITWDLFNKSHIERGKQHFENKDFNAALKDFQTALTYPENIGVGRSNTPTEAPAHYWQGKALQALGRINKAKQAWTLGAQSPEGSKEQNEYRTLCKELSRR